MNKERMLAIARRHGATLMHTQEGHEVVCLDPSSFERFCTELIAKAAQRPAGDVVRDAERYRFLAERCRSASEHWRGRWWIVIDGPAPKSHDSEDDFDDAIDAALASSARKGE